MAESVLDLYLTRRAIRVSIDVGRFPRTSDMLNNMPGEFLEGFYAPSEDERAYGLSPNEGTPLAVRLSEICFLVPIVEPPSPPSAEHRDRFPERIVLEIDDWQMSGTLFLVDKIRWVDFMAGVRNRFLPLRDVVARMGDNPAALDVPFVIVNAARIDVLFSAG